MNMIWVLLAIVLVLLFLGTRERLEPTDKIKAPGSDPSKPYSDEEVNRALAMVPDSVTQPFVKSLADMIQRVPQGQPPNLEEELRRFVGGNLQMFYYYGYKPATSRVTEEYVDKWVVDNDTGGGPGALEFKKALLKAYFVQQQGPANQPINATPDPMTNRTLEPVTISPPPTVPPSPVQPVLVQPPGPDTNAPAVPLPSAPMGSTPAAATNQIPTRWTHACFFSPTN